MKMKFDFNKIFFGRWNVKHWLKRQAKDRSTKYPKQNTRIHELEHTLRSAFHPLTLFVIVPLPNSVITLGETAFVQGPSAPASSPLRLI